MRIASSISQSFLLVSSLRSVEETHRLLRETRPQYLVVTAGEAPDHYLVPAKDFDERVADAPGEMTLHATGLLRGICPAPVHTGAGSTKSREPFLLFEDGVLTEVFVPVSRRGRPRSELRFSGGRPRAEPVGHATPARYIRGALPEEVSVGETVVLAVAVGVEGSSLKIVLPGGSEVDIVVHAREGFALEGSGTGTFRLPDDGSTTEIEFRLLAVTPGLGLVRVYAFHDGSPLGSLTLRPVVRPAPGPGEDPGAEPAMLLKAAGVLDDPSPSDAPDLTLLILEERSDGRPALTFRVTAHDTDLDLNLREFGPVALRMEPVGYFDDFFGDIEALGAHRGIPAEVVERKLESKGARLFESIFPEELQALLWSLHHRIGSIHIYSQESWIPWELCRLTGSSDGAVTEGPFFCEAFEITRLFPGTPRRPRLTLNNMAVVAPGDSGLTAVREERQFLLSLAADGRSVREVPARYLAVRCALGAGTFDAFHFSGHGAARASNPDRSPIYLEGREALCPEDLSGKIRNLGRSRPLVFLNSCQGARGAFTIVGTGGWARRYLDAGAGAFIGAYWSISDPSACNFARVFYRELCAGKTLGAAVRAARLAIRKPGDPTWLAYSVYGDPFATLHS